ncbi:MAG: hypothetical protein RXR41_01220 [Candidatus Marsarchaeota archaeon]
MKAKDNRGKRGVPKAGRRTPLRSPVFDAALIFAVALALRLVPDFLEPPHVTTDPDFWYYYMAAKEPSWFSQLYGSGQPLATTYFADLAEFFSSLFHYSLAMTMKIGFAAVDSASAVGLYLVGRRLYNRQAGFLSGLAYAVSAQALQGSSLKVRHDGFAVCLIIFAGYVLSFLATQGRRPLSPSGRAKEQAKRLYFPLSSFRPRHWPHLLALVLLVYGTYLLTFYQFLVMVGVLGAYFAVSEFLAWVDDRRAFHLMVLALLALVAAFAFYHYDVPYLMGWSVSSSAFIIELAPFNPYYALEWLNLLAIFVPFGLYFALKERDAFSLGSVLVTFPLYYLALRGILYFMIPVVLLFGVALKGVRLKKTLAALVLTVAVINVAIYYQTYPIMIEADGTDEAQYRAALWIRENSPAGALVLANWDRGHLIQAVSERNVVWSGQYVPSVGQVVSEAMYSTNESAALHYLKQLGSPEYVFLVQGTLVYEPSENYLSYITGIGSPPAGFNLTRTPSTTLYRMLYDPASLKDLKLVYENGGVYVFEVNYTTVNGSL